MYSPVHSIIKTREDIPHVEPPSLIILKLSSFVISRYDHISSFLFRPPPLQPELSKWSPHLKYSIQLCLLKIPTSHTQAFAHWEVVAPGPYNVVRQCASCLGELPLDSAMAQCQTGGSVWNRDLYPQPPRAQVLMWIKSWSSSQLLHLKIA